MPATELKLTTDQLVSAYNRLGRRERRTFLSTVLTQPAHQQLALELLTEAQASLRRKFPPARQRLLDKLLDVNNERALRPAEQKRLNELIEQYGEDLVEKARARYLVELSRRADQAAR